MNIYIGWLISIAIFGFFLMWGIYIGKQINKDEYYSNYAVLINLASFFLPISGIAFAYPFMFNNENYDKYIEWSLVYRDFLRACVFEVIMLFCFFVPLFYKKVRLEKTNAALADAFLRGAIKYGVSNNHFEPNHNYSVRINELHIKAPMFYMYDWSVDYQKLDEVTLIEEESKERIVMSMEHLWLRLAPIGKTGYVVFPWSVKWEKDTFPRKEFMDWCKARGIKNIAISA